MEKWKNKGIVLVAEMTSVAGLRRPAPARATRHTAQLTPPFAQSLSSFAIRAARPRLNLRARRAAAGVGLVKIEKL